MPDNPASECAAIICDGAVRSGKTFCLSISFALWATLTYDSKNFAICGKTIGSVHRNIITTLIPQLEALGLRCNLVRSKNLLEVEYENKANRFYIFGGNHEGSAGLIQGITLAGVLFDEVALMPRSFVEQALARCSVEGARFWFNCNPEHPSHWFYRDWIKNLREKNAYYLHFSMEDNPSLSSTVLERYKSLYHGVFYQRYILGEWTAAHGAVYPMFSKEIHVVESLPKDLCRFVVSCDYGTVNPTSMGLWGYSPSEKCWYRVREYYHCSRTTGVLKTDSQYADRLTKLVADCTLETVVVDPSAASFIQCLRQRGYTVNLADNNIVDGVRLASNALMENQLRFHYSCKDIIREFSLYRWDTKGGERPIQKNDHAMDDMRYFVRYALAGRDNHFFAIATGRNNG